MPNDLLSTHDAPYYRELFEADFKVYEDAGFVLSGLARITLDRVIADYIGWKRF